MELRKLRESVGVARYALASQAGVSHFRLFQAEHGMLELRPDEMQKIDAALRSHLAKLLEAAADYQGLPQVSA